MPHAHLLTRAATCVLSTLSLVFILKKETVIDQVVKDQQPQSPDSVSLGNRLCVTHREFISNPKHLQTVLYWQVMTGRFVLTV